LRSLGLGRDSVFPRLVTIRTLIPQGCRFEVGNPVEAFRVEQFGNEEGFTNLILQEIQPTDVFYDVGASVGLVTVHAAQKGAHVVAFEPDPSYCSRLKANLALNGLQKTQIMEWAVADKEGEATLFTDGIEGNSPCLREIGKRGAVRVHMDSIDNALQRGLIPRPDVVKMDIEGAEVLALRGMQRLLQSEDSPRALFIEIHPVLLSEFRSSPQEVHSILAQSGFSQEYRVQRAGEVHCIFRKAKATLK
jgi:FkbM family methyltransferase